MTMIYARNDNDKKRRDVRYMRNLQRTASVYLPETASATIDRPARGARWKTFRLRPELAEVIAVIQARFAANRSLTLTTSEVLAAALIEALPIMTAQEEFR